MSNDIPPPPMELPPARGGARHLTHLWWRTAIWITSVVIGVVAACVWYASVYGREYGGIYAGTLLLISTALLIAGAVKATPPWWIVITCACLEIWKVALLIVYTNTMAWGAASEALSVAAVGVSCGILVVILIIARLIIDKPNTQAAVRTHLFATICAALYLFSHVAYDLTFALALEDRCGNGRALQYTAKPTSASKYFLHFRAQSASLNTAVLLSKMVGKWPADDNEKFELVRDRYPDVHEDTARDVAWNAIEWKKITDHVSSNESDRWRVTIVGHATDAVPVDVDARTNEALAQDRVDETYQQLKNVFPREDIRIEWVLRPVSNDDNQAQAERYQRGRDHKGGADVVIESGRPIELLDYAYFMIYTITTTGYGDIIPISPRAKFITSIANIFEILFIVVLFNLVFVYAKRD